MADGDEPGWQRSMHWKRSHEHGWRRHVDGDAVETITDGTGTVDGDAVATNTDASGMVDAVETNTNDTAVATNTDGRGTVDS